MTVIDRQEPNLTEQSLLVRALVTVLTPLVLVGGARAWRALLRVQRGVEVLEAASRPTRGG